MTSYLIILQVPRLLVFPTREHFFLLFCRSEPFSFPYTTSKTYGSCVIHPAPLLGASPRKQLTDEWKQVTTAAQPDPVTSLPVGEGRGRQRQVLAATSRAAATPRPDPGKVFLVEIPTIHPLPRVAAHLHPLPPTHPHPSAHYKSSHPSSSSSFQACLSLCAVRARVLFVSPTTCVLSVLSSYHVCDRYHHHCWGVTELPQQDGRRCCSPVEILREENPQIEKGKDHHLYLLRYYLSFICCLYSFRWLYFITTK